jgi:dihydrofolate reductase
VRRIINSTYVTLDGVIQNPQNWPSVGGFSDEGNQVQTELLESCDAVLMGRRTYESFAPVWPARSGDPLSDRMNAVRKYVVATTLTDPAVAQHDRP